MAKPPTPRIPSPELSPLARELRKRGPFECAEEETMLNLLRTAWAVSAGVERLIKSFGLSGATYNVLRTLRGEHRARSGGAACGEIGERMVVRVPDVTRLVDRLEALGLARRQRADNDRRVVQVAITPKGLDLMAKIDEPLAAMHKVSLGHMSSAEHEQLNRLLVRARERAGE